MRRLIGCFLAVLLALSLPVGAKAAVFQDVQYVVDQADLLTDQENIYLNNRAAEISETYGVDVLIAAVEDMAGEYADAYAASLNGDRGWWDTDNAVLFLLAMEEREWYIATFGTAVSVFSDRELDDLGYGAAEDFSQGEYYAGFSSFLSGAESCLLSGDTATVYREPGLSGGRSYEHYGRSFGSVLPLSLVIGLAAAAIALLVMRSAMNTKKPQRNAAGYMNPGSYRLHTQRDIFLYSNVSKTRRQENTSGGSSIHRSSGGRSHGGRGGRF